MREAAVVPARLAALALGAAAALPGIAMADGDAAGGGAPPPSVQSPGQAAAPVQIAQFQLPPARPAASADGATPSEPTPTDPSVFNAPGHWPRTLVQELKYQYGYGSESAVNYLRNPDLNKTVPDSLLLLTPQLNGIVVWRPVDWLELTLEMIAELEIASYQPEVTVLPNGTQVPDLPTKSYLLVDQGFVALKRVLAPFELSVGRRNYEDERHWLIDTSLDVGSILYRGGPLRADFFAGREVWKNLNLVPNTVEATDRINTTMLYVDYRGIEDLRLAAYQFTRNDLSRELGFRRLIGVRAIGRPSNEFNFWTEAAYLRGTDPSSTPFRGWGIDAGFTQRVPGLPLHPSFTFGYAFGSGDDNPDDGRNRTFHQTGLQSNESRFAGAANFKYYGEALDPELSNLEIFTVGVGFWPASNVSVDLVYHKYRLDKLADEVAGSPITAETAQVDGQLSKDVGQAFDVVVGLRNLFGLRRLGMDLRMGWFFPGKAFLRNDGSDDEPLIRRADKTIAFVAKLWW